MIPRMHTALAAAAVLALTSGAAMADPINFAGSFTVSAYTGSNDGLTIYTQNESSSIGSNGNLAFSLNEGQSTGAKNLFDIYTPEGSVERDDKNPKQISVAFSFTQPAPAFGGSATGTTVGQATFLGIYQNGHLSWDNNGVFNIAYPDGGSGDLQVTLTGGDFNGDFFRLDSGECDGLIVTADFKNVTDPVPEPASIALFGVGLLGLGIVGMRRSGQSGTVA